MAEAGRTDPQSIDRRDSSISQRNTKRNGRGTNSNASVWRDLLAGGIAGTAGILVGHPFDTIKVRLQQQDQQEHSKSKSSSPRSRPNALATKRSRAVAAKASPGMSTARTSSLYRGLFRGIGAPLATAALVNANMFCVHGAASRFWDRHHERSADGAKTDTETVSKQIFCGAVSGIWTSLMVAPIELVKVQLQTTTTTTTTTMELSNKGKARANTSCSLATQILRSDHGLRGLYRGLSATILRQTPSLAVYFPTYQALTELIDNGNPTREVANDAATWWTSALAGGLAGSVAWATVYPVDVIKSRIQSLPLSASREERSLRTVALSTLQTEGYFRLMTSRGLAVTLLRAFPVNGTIFCVYEHSSEWLWRWEDREPQPRALLGAQQSSATTTAATTGLVTEGLQRL
mmetsp:Transcript_13819/g.32273  ORF Transcript_13819/g.32273 Transcript_13819/m.32273 type:complete len:405 (+) Transcript_13819:47-1261(+)